MLGIQDLELRVFAANAGAPQAKATAGVDLPGVASQPAPRAAKPHIVQGRAGSVSRNPPREDRQLETLLALVAGAGGSLEEVTLQLTTELEALEVSTLCRRLGGYAGSGTAWPGLCAAQPSWTSLDQRPDAMTPPPSPTPTKDAGVHELLESEDQVLSLRQDLDATIGLLDDLEDNLSIFDAKMGLMRQDVAGEGGCPRMSRRSARLPHACWWRGRARSPTWRPRHPPHACACSHRGAEQPAGDPVAQRRSAAGHPGLAAQSARTGAGHRKDPHAPPAQHVGVGDERPLWTGGCFPHRTA